RRDARRDRGARVARGDGHRRAGFRWARRLGCVQRVRDLSAVAASLCRRHDTQHRARVRAGGAAAGCGHSRAARAPAVRLDRLARSGGEMLFLDQSRCHPDAAGAGPRHEGAFMKPLPYLAFAWLAMTSFTVCAQGATPRDVPTVTVTASATASVANDRLQAWLRTEAEHVDPAAAANQVNAAMAKALARAKGAAGVT